MAPSLLTACGIVLLDFLVAYSTVAMEHYDVLRQPLSYELPTCVRLVIAIVLWRKFGPVTSASVESGAVTNLYFWPNPLSLHVGLVAGWLIALSLVVAVRVNHNGFKVASLLGYGDLV